jgi:hypothetical protein
MGRVNYEWDIETVDPESKDILDHNHDDKLDLLSQYRNLDLETEQICLVRDVWGEDTDLKSRGHWYPLENRDYPFFSCGAIVPKRFLKEFDNWRSRG